MKKFPFFKQEYHHKDDFSADSSQIEEQLNNGELRDSLIQEGRYNQLPSYRKVHASFTSQKSSMYLINQIQNISDQFQQQFLSHQLQDKLQQQGSSSLAITERTLNTQTLTNIKTFSNSENLQIVDIIFDERIIKQILAFLSISDIIYLFDVYLLLERSLQSKKSGLSIEMKSKSLFQISFSPTKRQFAEEITNRLISSHFSLYECQKFFEIIIRYDGLIKQFPDLYEQKNRLQTDYEQDIQKDVERTFYDTKYLNNQIYLNQLIQILTALSHSVSDVGYIQGWNQIAGVFVKNQFSPQLIYWIINFIMHKMQAKQLFLDNFKAARVLDYQFEIICKNYIPDLYSYLKKYEFDLNYFSNSWFLTLFSFELPYSCVLRVWMLFLLKGWKYLIKIGIAILKIVKQKIMSSADEDEINQFLKKHICNHFQINPSDQQTLFDVAKQVKVSNTLLDKLDQLYKNSFPELKMNIKIKSIKIGQNKQKTIIELEKEQIVSNRQSIENWSVEEEAGTDTIQQEQNGNSIFNRRATLEHNYYIGGQKRQNSQNALPSQSAISKTQILQQNDQQNINQANDATLNGKPSQIIKRNSDITQNVNNSSSKSLKITKIIGQSHIPYSRATNSVVLNNNQQQTYTNASNNNFSQIYQTPCKNQLHIALSNSKVINTNQNQVSHLQLNSNNQSESTDQQATNRNTIFQNKSSIKKDIETQLPSLQTQTTLSSQNQINFQQNSSVFSSTAETRKNEGNCTIQQCNSLLQSQNSQREDISYNTSNSQCNFSCALKQTQINNHQNYQLASIPEQVNGNISNTQQNNYQNPSSNSIQNSQNKQDFSKQTNYQNPNHLQYYNYNNNNGSLWPSSSTASQKQEQSSFVSNNQAQQQQHTERITLSMLNLINKSKNYSKDCSPNPNLNRFEDKFQVDNQSIISSKKSTEVVGIKSTQSLSSPTTLNGKYKTESHSYNQLMQPKEEKKQATQTKDSQLIQNNQIQEQQIEQKNQQQNKQQLSQKYQYQNTKTNNAQMTNRQNESNSSFFQKIINIFRTKENQASYQANKNYAHLKETQDSPHQQSNNLQNAQNHSFNKQQRNKSFDVIGVIENASIQQINSGLITGGAINRKYSNNEFRNFQTEISIRNLNDLSHESISDEGQQQTYQEQDLSNNNTNRFATSRKCSIQNGTISNPQFPTSAKRNYQDNQENLVSKKIPIERAMSFKKTIQNEPNLDKGKKQKIINNYFISQTQPDYMDSPIAVESSSEKTNYQDSYKNNSSYKKKNQFEEKNGYSQQQFLNQIRQQQQQNIIQSKQAFSKNNNNNGSLISNGSQKFINNPQPAQGYLHLQQNQIDQHSKSQAYIYNQPTTNNFKRFPLTSQISSKRGETDYQQSPIEKGIKNQIIKASSQITTSALSPAKQQQKEEENASVDDSADVVSIKLRGKQKNLTKISTKTINQISPSDYKLQIFQGVKISTSNVKSYVPQEFASEQKSPIQFQQTNTTQAVQPFDAYNYSSSKKTFNDISEFNHTSSNSVRVFNCKSNTNLPCNEELSPTKDVGSINNNNFYYLGNPQYYQSNYKNKTEKSDHHLSLTSEIPYISKKEKYNQNQQQQNISISNTMNKNSYYCQSSQQLSSTQPSNLQQKNAQITQNPSSITSQLSIQIQKNYQSNPKNFQNNEYNSSQSNTILNRQSNPENQQSIIQQELVTQNTNSFFSSNQQQLFKKHSITVGNLELSNKKIQ
ncbi:rab-GTPase-TBC domain protein (macronuclear) [Tetrahymena thermophila SB210]|uniref:Rab-GTPase-TBC domain protein n=1 Tax=Tetrahymena thermophila (strain SB210) TaxID=312017 RepID=Q23DB0_TETTS|nr:rab-GTPase-TBC domain protein [Tetrahymena thermophila SB210]EAR94327.2 rab-GTPase-TBC domain protein [Tetrahymena thermophila SB210]|eukprot:XP_001014776.2 rab-GTPase-TBC domain protein [Tetrahymena thermophila SB210]